MAFPTTGVLDNFTRPNESPLSDGGDWRSPIFNGYESMSVVGDVAVPNPDGAGTDSSNSYWEADFFGGAVEVWATFASYDQAAAAHAFVGACLGNLNTGAETGYILQQQSSGELTLRKVVAGGTSDLLADYTGLTLADGDSIGISVNAGTVTAYHKHSGTWTTLGSASDSAYASGAIGFGTLNGTSGASPTFSAFGGGGTAIPNTPQLPYVQSKRGLYLTVTDLSGEPILSGSSAPLPVKTPDTPQVTIPLSDSRTGQVAVSMFEKIAPVLQAATTVVKVLYINPKGDESLVLNGIVLSKVDDFDEETTTVQLHDSTIRLKKRYLGYDHASIMLSWGLTVDGVGNYYSSSLLTENGLEEFYNVNSVFGIPLDGFGLRLLLLDASHGEADWNGWPIGTAASFYGIPTMGIRYQPDYSVDNANPQPAYGAEGIPPTGFVIHGTLMEGSPDITGVTFPGGQVIGDVYEYGALSGPGIADFAQVLSATGTTIVMSQDATLSESMGTINLEDAIYCQLTRGDCVYDDLTDMVQAQGALECNFEPVDADHKGPSGGTWEPGQLCEFYTANRVGTDRSQGNAGNNPPVTFVHGIGGFHLTHSPDADQLITYSVECGPGGPNDPNDFFGKVTVEADTVPTYGIWEDWEQATSAGNGDNPISNAVLADRSDAILTGFQNPPQFITAVCDTDRIGGTPDDPTNGYCYGTDFFLGDTVTVYAKRGYVTVGPLAVRITQVGISRIDESGNCQLELTMVPYLTAGIDPGSAV